MMYKMTELKYEPDPRLERALDVLFILHADHEQNASTARCAPSARPRSTRTRRVAAGVAALYGPLHGGANEQALRMLNRIGSVENIPDFLEGVKEGKERLMGFGHRVYKNYDPRARIIKKHLDEVFEVMGKNPLLDIAARAREARARRRLLHLAQALPERRLLLGPAVRGAAAATRRCSRSCSPSAARAAGSPSGSRWSGLRAEDRPPAPDLHGRARARRTCRRPAVTT